MVEILASTFEYGITLIESCIFVDFIEKYNTLKYNKTIRIILFVIGVTILFINTTLTTLHESFSKLCMINMFIICVIYCQIGLNGNVREHILSSLFITLGSIVINSLIFLFTSSILKFPIKTLAETTNIYRISMVLISKIIFFYYTRIILSIKKYRVKNVPLSLWFIILIVPSISLIIMEYIMKLSIINVIEGNKTVYMAIIICGIISINIIIYYIMHLLDKEYETKKQMNVYEAMNSIRKDISILYENVSTIRHDLNYKIVSIKSMIDSKDYKSALNKLNNLYGEINVSRKIILTNEPVLDMIINSKAVIMEKQKINFTYHISKNLTSRINIDDFSVLVGNLINNAIEAVLDLNTDTKNIFFAIDKNSDTLSIFIKNTIDISILHNNSKLETTKKDKKNHGYGLKSIKKIVNKYDGLIKISEKNKEFCVYVEFGI